MQYIPADYTMKSLKNYSIYNNSSEIVIST